MSHQVTLADLIESLADFDKHGGASVTLVAWDLCVEDYQLLELWQQATRDGLIRPSGSDQQQILYRLTPAGWAAYDDQLESA